MEDIKQVPSFLIKLYEILESEQAAICWNKEGTTFQIQDPELLTDQILPQYFKHRNYQSFLRQLNMYGFKKLKNKQGKNEFVHQQFRRGVKNNLLKIKRRNQEDIKQSLETLTKEFQSESYLIEHEKMRRQLMQMQQEQQRILYEIRFQMDRNRKLQRETQDIIDVSYYKLMQKINQMKNYSVAKLNKLVLIIQKLPQDAQISKMAMLKDKILRKLETIEQDNCQLKDISFDKQESNSYYEPNLTGVRSPAGYSPKTK
ncbi:unnamed protein product (macronuclear) [Paramecium tetraurelia]|uniref:HSF-type DNA-binding domain-containing protein n=1 Tax=Paramecium tetraurelia TaxID=5888 RepID=A0C485_PARTE|nr:uncharacterized protein GSPATT00035082001 [Paramecium tetraurelia]CAK65602.1 unnamed protein product [Paramecium tetraurelia]|eukprot:XP_001432999.1 hypothetical protein (macronuclear) [Paramecium tetraurelia strain d4-2]